MNTLYVQTIGAGERLQEEEKDTHRHLETILFPSNNIANL